MYREDFGLIAGLIANLRGEDWISDNQLDALANEFAHRLQYSNPAFKRGRFLEACGVA